MLLVVSNHLTAANLLKITAFSTLSMNLEISLWLPRVHLDIPVQLMSYHQVKYFLGLQINYIMLSN